MVSDSPQSLVSLVSSMRLFVVIAAAGLLFASTSTAETQDAADRAPVLLRKTPLLPPVEAVGTDVTPEVKVAVEVNRRGAVTSVEILGIEPSGELDEAFERTTTSELLTWRYAPAIEDGEAVASTLEWTVKFQASEAGSLDAGIAGSLARLDGLDERLRRREIARNLPFGRQRQILLDYARIAERSLDRTARQQADTPRFVVVTDLAAEGAAEVIAGNLEAALNSLSSLYQSSLEPQPHGLKTMVYLYSRRDSLHAMRREISKLSFDNAEYLPPGLISGHVEGRTSEQLMGLLVHEASHAYSDHHLRSPGTVLPLWLEEGLAQYMENSEIKKGQLVPGRTIKRRFVLNHFSGGAHLATTRAGWDLDRVKRAIWTDRALTLSELVAADRLIFYAEESPLYYATAWLFVHFLRQGEDGWQETRFPTLMLYLAEGYSGAAAIEWVYGRSVVDLEEDFLRYVKRF